MENIDISKIRGAYATVILQDGTVDVEIMTMPQIRAAWEMGHGGGATKAHKNFTDQMALKTVINRACKLYISTSDDGGLVEGRATYEGQDPSKVNKEQKIAEKGSKKKLDIDEAEVVSEEPKTEAPAPEKKSEPAPEEKPGKPEDQVYAEVESELNAEGRGEGTQGTIGPGF